MVIIDRKVRKLWSKDFVSMKVLLRNHTKEKATWETENNLRVKYLQLFQSLRTHLSLNLGNEFINVRRM